jgi:hypothetical protein
MATLKEWDVLEKLFLFGCNEPLSWVHHKNILKLLQIEVCTSLWITLRGNGVVK